MQMLPLDGSWALNLGMVPPFQLLCLPWSYAQVLPGECKANNWSVETEPQFKI